MIGFFRKTRKKLAGYNKPLKYMRYAVGEIALVVIGILIALQINNWNENNKTEAKVKSSLEALKSDLIKDTLLITERLPFINDKYQLNESFRDRIANPKATVDTLIQIMRHEFNPNWRFQILYNTNAYNNLNQTGLMEELPDSIKANIETFYNKKFYLISKVQNSSIDYRNRITNYIDTYTFGSTSIHDQGPLINKLTWEHINPNHLAATFNGISNFKRILFTETKEELDYSLTNSRKLLKQIKNYLKER